MLLTLPDGTEKHNPTTNDILALLDQSYEYWLSGSGSASLSENSIEKSKEVLMFYNDGGYGYVAILLDSYKAPYHLMNKDESLITVHQIGGEPFPVPLAFHINHSEIKNLLVQYLSTLQILNFESWRDIFSVFDYDKYIESEYYYNNVRIFDSNDL